MKYLLFANTDWYLWNFRLPLALALKERGHEVLLVSPPGKHAARFAAHGLRWVGFDFSRNGLNPFAEGFTLSRASSRSTGARSPTSRTTSPSSACSMAGSRRARPACAPR